MNVTRHLFISGRVQGVSFRAFTRDAADRLGVRGWVRNLDDGRVEAVVSGSEAAVAELIEALREGPAFGKVDGIEASESDAAVPERFEIRR